MVEAERMALAMKLLPLATAIDWETAQLEHAQELVAAAKAAGVQVIASNHDFEKTPDLATLQQREAFARSLGAEVIVCDEIGDTADAAAILAAAGAGVPLVASAHADGIEALRARPPLRAPIEGGVFGAYIGIARSGDEYSYTVERDGLCCG